MPSPAVSVVTLNWNGIDDTLQCLGSLSAVHYDSLTIIVVDNASQDDQAEKIARRFPNVTVLRQDENLGFCGGCNVGMRHALEEGAEYVLLLNNDSVVPPDLISRLVPAFSALPQVAAVSPIVLCYPETERVSITQVSWDPVEARFDLRRDGDQYEDFAGREPYVTQFTCGCCLLTSAAVLREHGLLDERYFAYFDEAEWCERLRRKGLESYIVPSAVVYHRGGGSTPGAIGTYLMTRNRLLWMKENLPLRARLRSFPLLARDAAWHTANILGLTKPHYSRRYSRAALHGYRDYFLRRFGKWGPSTERLLLAPER